MSGTIHITSETVWTSGTIAFQNIADRTRALISKDEAEFLREAFLPLDQGFDFVALDGLTSAPFTLFCHKCQQAFNELNSQDKTSEMLEGVLACWSDFLELLLKDKRYTP